jgi:hypothetical protein
MERHLLGTESIPAFRKIQDLLQEELQEWLIALRKLIQEYGLRRSPQERLGLHLWIHKPSTNELVLWASSDRAWRDPRTLVPVPITRPTNWVAVEAFCAGSPVSMRTDIDSSSRWNTVLGIPIRLDAEPMAVASGSDPWGMIPVGVLTLASTASTGEATVDRLDFEARSELVTLLSGLGSELLRP